MVRDRETLEDEHPLTFADCVRFQELMLCSKLIFIGGMAEAKSKGRGEECISQNLRILRGHNGKRVMLFFANSQRRELKRYVSIPREFRFDPATATLLTARLVNCIGSIKPPKKAGRPALLDLNPNFEILCQMRNLTIQFLDDDGQCTFEFLSFRTIRLFLSLSQTAQHFVRCCHTTWRLDEAFTRTDINPSIAMDFTWSWSSWAEGPICIT